MPAHRARADVALSALGVVEAGLAKADGGLHLMDGVSQADGLRGLRVQDVIGDALSGLRPHARQALQFIQELLYGGG